MPPTFPHLVCLLLGLVKDLLLPPAALHSAAFCHSHDQGLQDIASTQTCACVREVGAGLCVCFECVCVSVHACRSLQAERKTSSHLHFFAHLRFYFRSCVLMAAAHKPFLMAWSTTKWLPASATGLPSVHQADSYRELRCSTTKAGARVAAASAQ